MGGKGEKEKGGGRERDGGRGTTPIGGSGLCYAREVKVERLGAGTVKGWVLG